MDEHRGLPLEPLSSGPEGTYLAEPEGGSGIALLLVVVVVIGVLLWFAANVVTAVAASCGGG